MRPRSGAYYNEHDANAAAWLRELIKQKHIADGEVDERSIVDVAAEDVRGFTQCHWFAGIGVWSYALRCAGWDDARPVWTGSCPCQPFSASGKQEGFSDERHLWPHLFRLISQCRPDVCFGEQVASPLGLAWIDAVHADLEGAGYAVGAVDTCAAGVGAPHIRQRLYWVADAGRERCEGLGLHLRERGPRSAGAKIGRRGEALGLADAVCSGFGGRRAGEARNEPEAVERSVGLRSTRVVEHAECARLEGHGGDGNDGSEPGWVRAIAPRSARTTSQSGDVADSSRDRCREECENSDGRTVGDRPEGITAGLESGGGDLRPGPTNGLWGAADWLYCTDGKWRPVEPGTFPLAHGAPARVGRLRGYGNAINAAQATAFIEAYLDAISLLETL